MNGYCGGGPIPEETRAWLWGFMHGICVMALAVGFVAVGVEYGVRVAIGAALATMVFLVAVLGWAWDREPIEH